jgi:hypothetical protein
MKTLFTFLIILAGLSGYPQNSPVMSAKAGTLTSATSIAASSFAIEKIYPNPVRDVVTLDVRSDISRQVQLNLYNILGTEVKKWDAFDLGNGAQQLKLDLSFLKTGVYILKVSGSGLAYSQVLKKN